MNALGVIFLMFSFNIAVMRAEEDQIIGTSLNVTIRNELGNTEEKVTVQLYANEEDYKSEKNAVAEGVTDKKGVVKFKDLKPVIYYVLARKGDRDNFGGGEQTNALESGKFNKVTVVIQ